ncbi:hypothetical protein L1I30_02520 [Gillisia sp. M10.2A]|uniref:TonB-dependent receptor plug domain-containing protein n=1 Tax=Gillisia lutea TaxID=2909668 RepID=A0ABS9ECF6_9FLAO|nr:hypothetical protein [Gillisia lutea]MCF4100532.1 hypothetical protein [Gillisia lutea]
MKFKKLNSLLPILLLAFLNVFSSLAIASPDVSKNLNSRDFDYLQADQNTQALFLEEITVANYLIADPENLSGGSSVIITGISEVTFLRSSFNSFAGWTYQQDQRSIISHHIFPFHFFW